MNRIRKLTPWFGAALFVICPLVLAAQELDAADAADAPIATTREAAVRLHLPDAAPLGLVVLLPGYGANEDSFSEEGGSESTLIARLDELDIAAAVIVPMTGTLYSDDEPLEILDETIEKLRREHRIPDRVAIGGFSAGGTGAVRYAQRCSTGTCRGTEGVAAVFGVDSPLDFERLYRAELVVLARGGSPATVAESRMIIDALHRTLGGSPEQEPNAYRMRSPVLASSPSGGNAQLLSDIRVRMYTEPDVHWWIENRNVDYHAMSSLDHAALINVLRMAGNTEAELITTSDKGVRADGTRHPHSWSIVDEEELTRWLADSLQRSGAEETRSDD